MHPYQQTADAVQCFLMYPMVYCIGLPVKCWYAVGILDLTSVGQVLNPKAGSIRKELNHAAKLNCITFS